jgi:hypothetical protein
MGAGVIVCVPAIGIWPTITKISDTEIVTEHGVGGTIGFKKEK